MELARSDARDAAEEADEGLGEVLSRTLKRLGRIGRRLLSMKLHLLPVKEWTLNVEANAAVINGTISVTFGK